MVGKQTITEALWVSANFRWQVQNTDHRSEHKCRLEYSLPQHLMKLLRGSRRNEGNKPKHKKMWFEKRKKKNEKKEKIPWPRFKQGPPKCKVIS